MVQLAAETGPAGAGSAGSTCMTADLTGIYTAAAVTETVHDLMASALGGAAKSATPHARLKWR